MTSQEAKEVVAKNARWPSWFKMIDSFNEAAKVGLVDASIWIQRAYEEVLTLIEEDKQSKTEP